MSKRVIEELLQRVREGDQFAAAELHQRYVDRLIRLARSRLTPKFGRRVDPEDVVQSACRSFFRRVTDGRYQAMEDEQLWQLLATITVSKARKVVRRHTTQKRSVASEESRAAYLAFTPLTPVALAKDPSPEEATILIEETQRMMTGLTPLQRHIIQMNLQGYATEEIAQDVGCSERTVHRAIERARMQLEQALSANERG